MLDTGEQGGQLLIGVAVLRVLQVQIDNGPDDPLGHPGGQHCRDQQRQGQDDQNGLDHGQQQGHHRLLGAGHTNHRTVAEAASSVQGLLGQGRGVAPGGARLVGQRLLDLLPVAVVLHRGGVSLAVVEYGAVPIHPGHSVFCVEPIEIVHPVELHPLGHQPGLGLQLRHKLVTEILVQHAQKQGNGQHHHRDSNCRRISK